MEGTHKNIISAEMKSLTKTAWETGHIARVPKQYLIDHLYALNIFKSVIASLPLAYFCDCVEKHFHLYRKWFWSCDLEIKYGNTSPTADLNYVRFSFRIQSQHLILGIHGFFF
jgi:hypothetical protein